jgi:CBS domain-containing protein
MRALSADKYYMTAKIPPTFTVHDFMVKTPHQVTPEMKLQDVVDLMIKQRISGAPVVNSLGTLITVIGEGDTLRLAATEGLECTISHCLNKLPLERNLITLQAHNTFAEAYRIFLKEKIHRIPIVDGNGRLLGLVSRSNILKIFADAHNKKKVPGRAS